MTRDQYFAVCLIVAAFISLIVLSVCVRVGCRSGWKEDDKAAAAMAGTVSFIFVLFAVLQSGIAWFK